MPIASASWMPTTVSSVRRSTSNARWAGMVGSLTVVNLPTGSRQTGGVPDLGPARLWALAKHAVLFERLYKSLALWVVRRPDHGGPDDEVVGYARTVTPVMWLWIFAS